MLCFRADSIPFWYFQRVCRLLWPRFYTGHNHFSQYRHSIDWEILSLHWLVQNPSSDWPYGSEWPTIQASAGASSFPGHFRLSKFHYQLYSIPAITVAYRFIIEFVIIWYSLLSSILQPIVSPQAVASMSNFDFECHSSIPISFFANLLIPGFVIQSGAFHFAVFQAEIGLLAALSISESDVATTSRFQF